MVSALSSSLRRHFILGVLLAFLPSALLATDPFYDRLLDDGTRALERKDYESAARSLRLACFGLLDEAERLASCLSHLALAQVEVGDEEAFLETLDRLLEIEQRFQALERVEVDPVLQERLDVHLLEKVPYKVLKELPPFAHVARQQLERQIVALPVAERRQQLEQLLEIEPDILSWRILMAEVDLESKNFEAAAAGANRVLSRDAELLKAICIRGQSRAALGNCAGALIDLYTCDEHHAQEFLNRLKAKCHLALGQFDEANIMAQYLPTRERRTMEREIATRRQQAVGGADSGGTPEQDGSEPGESSPPPPPR